MIRRAYKADMCITIAAGIIVAIMFLCSRVAHAWLEPETGVSEITQARMEMDDQDRQEKAEEALDRIDCGCFSEKDSDRAYEHLDRDWK